MLNSTLKINALRTRKENRIKEVDFQRAIQNRQEKSLA